MKEDILNISYSKQINQELQFLKKQVENFEKKYLWSMDVALMNTILHLLQVNHIIISTHDIEQYGNKPYVARHDIDSGTICIEKYNKF